MHECELHMNVCGMLSLFGCLWCNVGDLSVISIPIVG